MPRVQMPDGCYGLDLPGGRKVSGRPGDVVTVSSEDARTITKSWYGQNGVMSGEATYAMGTKTSRVCTACTPQRRWNAWNHECPRCGALTHIEEEATP